MGLSQGTLGRKDRDGRAEINPERVVRPGWIRRPCRCGVLAALVWAQSCAVAGESPLAVSEIAPGVYVHHGRIETMAAGNAGDIANIGFIVGEKCVAVIDTGGSPAVGRALEAAVAERTKRPVCYVINTHAHPDHVLGNAAFKEGEGVTFIAHEDYAQALGARMQIYRQRFSALYDEPVKRGDFVAPDRTVSDTLTLDLGGRALALRAYSTAHTNSDLTVLDRATGTLWAGDLLFVEHVPIVDGSLKGWLTVLGELEDIEGVEKAVPGHGPSSVEWPEALRAEERYLRTLLAEIRQVIAEGGTIEDAIEQVGYSLKDCWLLFDDYHRRNVTAAYAELEWE